METRTVMYDDGTVEHKITPTRHTDVLPHDQYVLLTNIENDPERVVLYATEDGEREFRTAFRRRNIQFTPLTEIGRGKTDRLGGVTRSGGATLDETIRTVLQGFGFTPVPDGEWWINE
ncbi:hypothetical protein [Halapricum desulfuricans]|uniref:hypothetical protein n=1 Tax=Halapricum desulfuricans TaxID=2841257 RepID=UPI001E588D51|nr:hypothetical protein [Halapricum desulfuricans]